VHDALKLGGAVDDGRLVEVLADAGEAARYTMVAQPDCCQTVDHT